MIRGGYWGGSWGLSWAGTWGEAWLLLNQPYQELSLKGQVFVRSYLTRIHSVEVAERIVSVAALNNISVIDAEVVVAAKTGEAREKVNLYVTTAMVGVASQQERLAVVSKDAPLRETVLTKPNRVVAASAPLRIAVKSNL